MTSITQICAGAAYLRPSKSQSGTLCRVIPIWKWTVIVMSVPFLGEDCWTEPEQSCWQEPREKCWTVPEERCWDEARPRCLIFLHLLIFSSSTVTCKVVLTGAGRSRRRVAGRWRISSARTCRRSTARMLTSGWPEENVMTRSSSMISMGLNANAIVISFNFLKPLYITDQK